MEGTKAYINAAEDAGADVYTVVVEGQDHGFKPKYYMGNFLEFWKSKISWFKKIDDEKRHKNYTDYYCGAVCIG